MSKNPSHLNRQADLNHLPHGWKMTAVPKLIAQQGACRGITMKIPNLLIDFYCVCGEGGPCGGDVQIRRNERRKGDGRRVGAGAGLRV